MRTLKKTVLITGAGRGIGLGLAKNLAQRGCRIALHYLDGQREAEEVALDFGGSAIRADLSIPGEAGRVVREASRLMNGLDALINNAAIDYGPVPFLEMSPGDFVRLRAVNFDAVVEASQAAAVEMVSRGQGGRIVQISSIHAAVTLPGRAAYAATKGAIEALTRSLALELAPHRITVNAIEPGFIEVERSRAAIQDYDAVSVGRAIPAGRVGTPDDIAALVAFLISEESGFITGDVIRADGGSSCLLNFPV